MRALDAFVARLHAAVTISEQMTLTATTTMASATTANASGARTWGFVPARPTASAFRFPTAAGKANARAASDSTSLPAAAAVTSGTASASAAAATTHAPHNRAGFPVKFGVLAPQQLYCARHLGTTLFPESSDGRCGPNEGPSCADCAAGVAMLAPPVNRAGATMRPGVFVSVLAVF
jgi:hypothetical protein